MITEKDLNSWEQLSVELDTLNKNLGERSERLLFRGQANSNWKLDTTLERKLNPPISLSRYYRFAYTDACVAEQQPGMLEWRCIRPDGAVPYLCSTGSMIVDDEGKPSYIAGTTQDITERKQIEAALTEEHVQHNEAQRIAHLGHWVLDLVNNDLVWSDENYRIFGLEPNTANTYETFLKFVHPDDYEFVDKAYTESVENRTPYDIEHRLLMKDGSIKWVNERCKTFYDNDGTPLRSIGTTLDITERKQAEALLKKSESTMKSIFSSANDAIFIVDPFNDKIVDVNPKAAVLLGYTIEELKGMPMSAVHPEEMDQMANFANEVLQHGKGYTNELHCKTKSGVMLPAEISASSLQLGDQLLMLAIVRDITERRQAEERIRHMAYHDPLTELPNRALFYDRLQHDLAHAHRKRELIALLVLDLDHFKPINDELGHKWGDQALIEIGKRLLHSVRATDTVARIGGDEFSIILVDVKSAEDAYKMAEKVIAAIGQPMSLKKSQYTLGVSIGICLASSPDDGDMDNMMGKADSAMYQAKKSGKNSYCVSGQ